MKENTNTMENTDIIVMQIISAVVVMIACKILNDWLQDIESKNEVDRCKG